MGLSCMYMHVLACVCALPDIVCPLLSRRYSWTALMINQFEGQTAPFLNGKTVLVRRADSTLLLPPFLAL